MCIILKSSVSLTAEAAPDYFLCSIGVLQREHFYGLRYIEKMQKEHIGEKIVTCFKLSILLYADDTVLLAEKPNDLKVSSNELEKYCDTSDLHINVNKTKFLFFSRGKLRKHHIFNFGEQILKTVDEYNYLGLFFNSKAKLKIAKSHLYQKGCRTMFSLIKKKQKCICLTGYNIKTVSCNC